MDIYIIFVFILFALAITDLIVGVSNDAVNFLVSAIGSKAAPFWVIMAIASAGILFGATFSSGMMEVARKGIFHPGEFYFDEIMVIFVAVMITDIILLDLFNTFGMPTSTTVSIVFELLGASVAMAMIKVWDGDGVLADYINSKKATEIVIGILVSVGVAFSVGALVQYITRLIFTFRTNKTLKLYGGLWGGVAITGIVYFILIKGLGGSSYANHVMADGLIMKEWVKVHAWTIIGVTFVGMTLIMQLLYSVFKVNILKVVVLTGTFALAMAFAGNDLVNFIGVPLAGLQSHEIWSASGMAAGDFSMERLAGKVATPNIYLVFAGIVMVGALLFSKKSRSVTKTSLDLSRQGDGAERFKSSMLSRLMVRAAIWIGLRLKNITSEKLQEKVSSRTNFKGESDASHEPGASFDLIRASVNLMVASMLISLGTSLKLPLSTTYVTFMVAMGSSLSDGAWGRESAVYRVTGVLSVIGGWFLTALVAFVISFGLAMLIRWGQHYAVIGLVFLIVALVLNSNRTHKKRAAKEAKAQVPETPEEGEEAVIAKSKALIGEVLSTLDDYLGKALSGIAKMKRKRLLNAYKGVEKQCDEVDRQKSEAYYLIHNLEHEPVEFGHAYLQTIEHAKAAMHTMSLIVKPLYEHVDNSHFELSEEHNEALKKLKNELSHFIEKMSDIVNQLNASSMAKLDAQKADLIKLIKSNRKAEVKRIKNNENGSRNSLLYLNLLNEIENLLYHTLTLVHAQLELQENVRS